MSFGSNIGYLRKKQGITQEELAERMYVSRQTVSRWETDSVYPDVETVIRLCDILECDMETLVRGDATRSAANEEKTAPKPEQQEKNEDSGKAHKPEAGAEIELEVGRSKVLRIVEALLFPLALVSYLVMGVVWDLWHPGWLVFVGAALIGSLISAINRPQESRVKGTTESMSGVDWDRINAAFCAIAFLVAVLVYIVLGLAWNLWHPGWLIFVVATVLCGISSVLCTLVFEHIDRKKK